jgi:hypothetical protein
MNSKLLIVKRLREAAVNAAARVSAVKGDLKAAKSRLKQARRLFKAEKKAAKQLRRKLKEAVAATFVRRAKPAAAAKAKAPVVKGQTRPKVPATRKKPAVPKKSPALKKPAARKRAVTRTAPVKKSRPSRTPKPMAEPDTMRSAAEVAKSVIERLHAPPPLLPPTPVIPSDSVRGDADSTGPGTAKP